MIKYPKRHNISQRIYYTQLLTRLHEVANKKEESMKRKPKELKVRICFEKDMCIPSRLRKIDEVVKKIKTLEKSGEYRCTLLEIEV